MFDAPTSGGSNSVRPADLEGHVLVVEPIEYLPSVITEYGDTDAIQVTVHDISEKTSYDDVRFFGSALIATLKRNIGKKVLAKMGKGEAKPGKSAPWILIDLTTNEKAVAAATTYMNTRTAASLSSPEAVVINKAAQELDDLLL